MCIAYCESHKGRCYLDLLPDNRIPRIQRRPNPGIAYLRRCSLFLYGVGLQVASKGCCCRQYTTHLLHTNGCYQKMMQWLGGAHVNPDVRGDDDDVWPRLNSAEGGGCRLVNDQRNRPTAVQETHPSRTNGCYQKVMQWPGSGHVNPDVRGDDDVWLRLNSAEGGCRFVGDQPERNRPTVVQE